MADCKSLVWRELTRIVPTQNEYADVLYDLVFDYPLRDAKALRPSLCIATCRAFGGSLEGVINSAAVLELYHNAFLIHDDVEDGSEMRRDRATLHISQGVPVAINVGDAMLALALEPLLDNMRLLSVGKALRILKVVARMARESAEGQATELSWIRGTDWTMSDRAYLRLVHKKTTHYTFIAPVALGGIVAGVTDQQLYRLRMFATALGSAFQIQDDILNLSGDAARVGKECAGDLWEGKHTLILLHALRESSASERARAIEILARPRPRNSGSDCMLTVTELAERLRDSGDLSATGYATFRHALRAASAPDRFKSGEDIDFLRALIDAKGSISYARAVARKRAKRAKETLSSMGPWIGESSHRDFLEGLAEFVIDRDR